MDLNYNERRIFNILQSKDTVTLDELMYIPGIMDKRRRFSKKNRAAMIVRVKYLSAKVAPFGWIIKRESKLGRGSKAVYKMEKKF